MYTISNKPGLTNDNNQILLGVKFASFCGENNIKVHLSTSELLQTILSYYLFSVKNIILQSHAVANMSNMGTKLDKLINKQQHLTNFIQKESFKLATKPLKINRQYLFQAILQVLTKSTFNTDIIQANVLNLVYCFIFIQIKLNPLSQVQLEMLAGKAALQVF